MSLKMHWIQNRVHLYLLLAAKIKKVGILAETLTKEYLEGEHILNTGLLTCHSTE